MFDLDPLLETQLTLVKIIEILPSAEKTNRPALSCRLGYSPFYVVLDIGGSFVVDHLRHQNP
jgi:hypothetical protein